MHAHRVPRSRHTRGTGAPGPAAPQPLLTGGGRALPAAARDRSRAAGARGARHGARRPDTGAARGPAQHISLAGLRVVNSPKAARLRLRTGQPRTATRARVPRTSRSTGTARTGRAVRSVLCATVGGRRANWVDVDQGLLSGCSVCVPSPTHSLWRARRRLAGRRPTCDLRPTTDQKGWSYFHSTGPYSPDPRRVLLTRRQG